MKKGRNVLKVVLIFLILFFFSLLCALIYLLNGVENTQKIQIKESNVEIEEEPKTIKDVLEKNEVQYINQIENEIYVVFPKDLYNENGESDKNFFENIVKELAVFFDKKEFYLIDEKKYIDILARYNSELCEYELIINNIEDFYSKTDGKSYAEVDKSQITKGALLGIADNILMTLQLHNAKFSSIKNYIDEGIDEGNGYVSYLNNTVRIRTVPSGAVKNIIFKDKYEGYITQDISTDMDLYEIKDKQPYNDFGSVEKGYLGYRHFDFYLFFYDDEVSVYTYSYKQNTTFEKLLKEYIETKDLDKFATQLKNKWKAYDYFEYNPEINKLYVLYSSRGVEIDIEDNETRGITLYNNYYFTSLTKKYVKNGLVSFNGDVDILEQTEIKRRERDS